MKLADFTPKMRAVVGRGASVIAANEEIPALIDRLVEQTLEELPELPRTERMRRVMWALFFTEAVDARTPPSEERSAA